MAILSYSKDGQQKAVLGWTYFSGLLSLDGITGSRWQQASRTNMDMKSK
jgi:hypothetical protein